MLLETQLLKQGTISKADIEKMEMAIQQEIKEAFEFAEQSPFPSPEEAFKDLYKETNYNVYI